MNYKKKIMSLNKNITLFADLMPVPVIISNSGNGGDILFVNRSGRKFISEIFENFDSFLEQALNCTGLIGEIIKKNDLPSVYSKVRESGEQAENLFIPFFSGSTEYSVLAGISMMHNEDGGGHFFLTTVENVSELFNFNRELHYSRKHLDGMIEAFARDRIAYLLAYGQEETVRHLLEVRVFSRLIACSLMREYSLKPETSSEYSKITPLYIKILELSALLHDFGKIRPDIHSIIMKPRKLTDSEYSKVKAHTVLGAELIGQDNRILHMSWLVARYHHEKWDGSGYPEGLRGKEIPLSARIVAFADMYSALRNKRAYKDAISDTDEIISIFHDCSAHYDPVVFKTGMHLIPEMQKKAEYIDREYRNFELNADNLVQLLKGTKGV